MSESGAERHSGASGATRRATSWKSSVPKRTKISSMPSTNPTSPMRLTMNAFLPASVADFFSVPEADQQVRAEADALPADEHHEEVRAEHEHEHERGEEIQVREVARELGIGLVVHVGGRVDVNQRADARHDRIITAASGSRRSVEGDAEIA